MRRQAAAEPAGHELDERCVGEDQAVPNPAVACFPVLLPEPARLSVLATEREYAAGALTLAQGRFSNRIDIVAIQPPSAAAASATTQTPARPAASAIRPNPTVRTRKSSPSAWRCDGNEPRLQSDPEP